MHPKLSEARHLSRLVSLVPWARFLLARRPLVRNVEGNVRSRVSWTTGVVMGLRAADAPGWPSSEKNSHGLEHHGRGEGENVAGKHTRVLFWYENGSKKDGINADVVSVTAVVGLRDKM